MKRLCIILAVVIIEVVFVGCKENAHKNNVLSGVLDGKEPFIDESGNLVYLKDYRIKADENATIIPERYASVDFDGDGTSELVLYSSSDYGVYLVFHIDGKDDRKVFGFELSERSLINLKKDGTFVQSGGAGLNGWCNLEFKDSTYVVRENAYEDIANNEYRLFGVTVNEDAVNDYIAEFDEKPDINWVTIAQ